MLSNQYTDIRINDRVYASGFVKEAIWSLVTSMSAFKDFPPHWVMVF